MFPRLAAGESPDRAQIGLRWFTTVRWITLVAGGGAVFAGRNALEVPAAIGPAVVALAVFAVSNLWLTWRAQTGHGRDLHTIAPWIMCADVGLLSWLLVRAGGVLNPASVFYLVEIVVAALVFGRRWTWIVASLAVVGYATLFLAPTDDLRAAQAMHPEIALHMQGMWLAFAATAVIIAALVTQLLNTIDRRDRALDVLRARNEGAMRAASLATLAAGAAHELSTPLGTIAVAARELERGLAAGPADALRDAHLIREEAARCRAILDDLAGVSGQPRGEAPSDTVVATILQEITGRLAPHDRSRVRVEGALELAVIWPVRPVVRALTNIVQNAVEALPAGAAEPVLVVVTGDAAAVSFRITDRGIGMTPEQVARAGEPFFTTKSDGTGLGLFVTRSTIEQLGGSFALKSRRGQGTEVTLTLPARATEARRQ